MKNLITILILFSTATLFSCTTVIYTHKQVLESYKTKDQVIKRFGQPTESMAGGENEEWLYSFQADNKGPAANPDVKTTNVTQFGYYQKYVIFTFDKQGNVTDRKAEGVNLTQKKKAPGKTIALIAGGVTLTAVIVWLVAIAAAGSVNYGGFSWSD